eukprot:Rmarinus@m.11627
MATLAKKLVLHVDVNHTVLIRDSACSLGVSGCVNSYLAGHVWGKVQKHSGAWECVSSRSSVFPPCPGSISYYRYLEDACERKQSPRSEFKTMLAKFTETPQGAPFRTEYEEIMESLKWRRDATCEVEASHSHVDVDPRLVVEGEYHSVLPSFFELLHTLIARNLDFALVFRTFGVDLPIVAKALDAYCDGCHPMYPAPPPTVASRLRLSQPCTAELSQPCVALSQPDSKSPQHCTNASTMLGPLRPTCPLHPHRLLRRQNDVVSLVDQHLNVIARTDCEVLRVLNSTDRTIGIVDDYATWASNDFHATKGKPFWHVVSPQRKMSSKYGKRDYEEAVHIFFDDSIRCISDSTIVDMREWEAPSTQHNSEHSCSVCSSDVSDRCHAPFRSVTEDGTYDRHVGVRLIPVDVTASCTNRRYFVETLDQCLSRQNE